jgi:hypothetical protein
MNHEPGIAPRHPNTLGKASLTLSIVASTCVFSIGLCAGVGQQQGWLKNVAALFFIAGGTFAFMGVLSIMLGFAGLFGRHRSRAAAIVGFLLGLLTVAMFLAIIDAAK